MKSLTEYLEQMERDSRLGLLVRQRRLADTMTALERLAEQGVIVNEYDAHYALVYTGTIDVDKSQLTAVRRALGRLYGEEGGQPVHNERNTIWVDVRPVDPQFQHLRFRFKRKLQRGAKCRIVTRRVAQRSLVCES